MDSSRIGELVVSNPLVVKFMDEICNGEWPKKETMIGILKDAVTKGVDNMKGSGTDEGKRSKTSSSTNYRLPITYEGESNLDSDFKITGQQSGSQATRYSRAALDEDLLESIKSTAATSKKFLTWDDVAGLENAKQELQIAAVMPYKQPQLFTGKRKACQFILLYGPPGTGKTHLARVIASRTESTLYNLSASDLTNMWVGNSARLARLMFQQARDSKPAVIFFDEIDAICGRRDNSHTESHTELKSELLAQMDGAKEDNTGILFIGATNLPWHLDSAFLSRFEKKIYIPMPDHTARPRLLEIELDHTFPKELEERISVETRGYSGSDIKRLAQEALQMPLREVQSATHFVKVDGFRGLVTYKLIRDIRPLTARFTLIHHQSTT